MFDQLQLHPAIAALALVLSIICLLGSLYLTYVAHVFNNLSEREQPWSKHRVVAIKRLAQEYGNAWYILMGITWFMPVLALFRGWTWWPSVYNHAEWVFKVAKWYTERENK